MGFINEYIPKDFPVPPPYDKEETIYTLILNGLCKKYEVKDALEKNVLSTIENMSRGRICIYKVEQLAKYAGGTVPEAEAVLKRLESRNIIVRAMLDRTKGWKLTEEVRSYANYIKGKIDRMGKDPKPHKSPN